METLAANVWGGVRGAAPDAVLVAHGGSVPATLWWLPGALVRTLLLVLRRRVDVVLVGDVLLYFFVGPLLRWTRTPHAVMAMGLDVTYEHRVYRAVVLPGVRRAPVVLAISAATAAAVAAAGVAEERIRVVTLGLPDPHVDAPASEAAGRAVRAQLGLPDGAALLVSVGRLVPRKGVEWFVTHVMPALPQDAHLVVAGDGPDRTRVEDAVERLGLAHRVHLLGRVDDARRDELMAGADLFVQPNVVVPGDMEGFGLVAIEAAMRGTVVVASDLEGLSDAVQDGVTGDLVASGDADAWIAHLGRLLEDRPGIHERAERYRAACVDRSSSERMTRQLVELLDPGALRVGSAARG
jgi:glycosyltransferase involved in cell wall biosynthesis